jgi:hypothetical protein
MDEVTVVFSDLDEVVGNGGAVGANLSSSQHSQAPPSPYLDPASEKASVVDVDKAIELFSQLQQSVDSVVLEELKRSQSLKKSQGVLKSSSGIKKSQEISKDVEMAVEPGSSSAPAPTGAEFDIRTFFEDSVRRAREVGHTPKRMGVVVKGLTVVGMGADAATIPDNLDIIKALNPLNW